MFGRNNTNGRMSGLGQLKGLSAANAARAD